MGYGFVSTKANENAQVALQTALLVFPLFYLALALTMTAATILTIQQLSEADRYRRQFALLKKLGMAQIPEPGVMVGVNSPGIIVAISLGIFFLIYAIYILPAYNSLKRSVLPI